MKCILPGLILLVSGIHPAEGELANIAANPIKQIIPMNQPREVRYVKFIAKHVVSGNGMVVAEPGCR